MRGSAIRIHHTRQIPTNDIGWGPPGALESGLMTGKRSVLVSVSRSRFRVCIRLLTAPDFLGFANCHRDQNGRHPFSFQELPDSYVRIIPKVAHF